MWACVHFSVCMLVRLCYSLKEYPSNSLREWLLHLHPQPLLFGAPAITPSHPIYVMLPLSNSTCYARFCAHKQESCLSSSTVYLQVARTNHYLHITGRFEKKLLKCVNEHYLIPYNILIYQLIIHGLLHQSVRFFCFHFP